MIGNLVRPLTHSVLYLHMLINKASPKAISRRTSYIRVRLEFLRYPQVIRELFNVHRFGPPLNFTSASTCSWIGHSVSGLLHDTIIFALFRLGFPAAPYLTQYLTSHHTNNSPDRSTKSTISHINVLYLLVNIGFQVLFHSPPGVLFNFPSRYYFTIGHQGVFSLTGWSPHIPTRFHVSCRTLDTTVLSCISLTGLSPSLVCFPKTLLLCLKVTYVVLTLDVFLLPVWALLLSLATTYRIDCFLSFPVGT